MISDSESEVTFGRVHANDVVLGLSFLHPHSIASPVRMTSTEVNVDRVARRDYMREWRKNAKLRRVEARDLALIQPRRSPRLAKKTM